MNERDEEENFRTELKGRMRRIKAIPGWLRPEYGARLVLNTKGARAKDALGMTWAEWIRATGRSRTDA